MILTLLILYELYFCNIKFYLQTTSLISHQNVHLKNMLVIVERTNCIIAIE